jgi:hypothetical protein
VTAVVGVELSPDMVRAVAIGAWPRRRVRTVEYAWDPDQPADAAAALRAALGPADRVAIAVDLAFLFAKPLRLPSVGAADKRRIIVLNPERYFPVRDTALVVATRADDMLVFALPSARLDAWITAIERTCGPVDRVDPGPVALTRALAAAHGTGDVRVRIDGDAEMSTVLEIHDDRLARIEIYPSPAVPADAVPLATCVGPPGVPAGAITAYGAALGVGQSLDEALVTPELVRRVVRRRVLGACRGLAAAALGVLALAGAFDASQVRARASLDARLAALRPATDSALALTRELTHLASDGARVGHAARERLDPLAVLRILTAQLPASAHLESIHGGRREDDWEVDGTAHDAARLIPVLGHDSHLANVHLLSSVSRDRTDGRTVERFSLGFRYVAAP